MAGRLIRQPRRRPRARAGPQSERLREMLRQQAPRTAAVPHMARRVAAVPRTAVRRTAAVPRTAAALRTAQRVAAAATRSARRVAAVESDPRRALARVPLGESAPKQAGLQAEPRAPARAPARALARVPLGESDPRRVLARVWARTQVEAARSKCRSMAVLTRLPAAEPRKRRRTCLDHRSECRKSGRS